MGTGTMGTGRTGTRTMGMGWDGYKLRFMFYIYVLFCFFIVFCCPAAGRSSTVCPYCICICKLFSSEAWTVSHPKLLTLPMRVFRCHWWKNGNPLYADSTTTTSGCSLRITELGSMHAGYYQCRATNMYGTALSSMINLQRAMIGSYQSSEPVDMRGLEQGQPHMIRCQPVKCFPQPSYTWQVIEKNGKDESPEAVETNTRVQIDERGLSADQSSW